MHQACPNFYKLKILKQWLCFKYDVLINIEILSFLYKPPWLSWLWPRNDVCLQTFTHSFFRSNKWCLLVLWGGLQLVHYRQVTGDYINNGHTTHVDQQIIVGISVKPTNSFKYSGNAKNRPSMDSLDLNKL